MIRKDLKHITLQNQKSKAESQEQNSTDNFTTAEGIEIKKTIRRKISKSWNFLISELVLRQTCADLTLQCM